MKWFEGVHLPLKLDIFSIQCFVFETGDDHDILNTMGRNIVVNICQGQGEELTMKSPRFCTKISRAVQTRRMLLKCVVLGSNQD